MAVESAYDVIKDFLEDDDTKGQLADPDGAHAIPPLCFENENFTAPNPPAPWVRMFVTGLLYGQQSIGASEQSENEWDEDGKLYLQVFVRIGSGGSRSHGLAKQLANLFRGKTLLGGNLEFMDAFIGDGEKAEDGNWYQRNVVIDFRRSDSQ